MANQTNGLDLYIQHGRRYLVEELDDWGPNGPTLKNCIGVHATYQRLYAYFSTPHDREIAERMTGWQVWEKNALEMKFEEGFLVAKFDNGSVGYFGHWGLIHSKD